MGSRGDEEEFKRQFTACVPSTLQEVLGETAGAALLFHLGPTGVAMDSKGLARSLERVLGGGSAIIEKLIVKNLSRTLGVHVDEAGQFEFVNSIEQMRTTFHRVKAGV